jgi:hypothetical protein
MVLKLSRPTIIGWTDDANPDPYAHSYAWFGVLLKRKAIRLNAVANRLETQRNVRGSKDFKTHQVSWDTNGVNGSWVRSIEKGGIIEFIVRAEYQAWVNIVKLVELEILYEPEMEDNRTTIDRHVTGFFEYIPLHSAREIRLILVRPAGFEAISYCWGDPEGRGRSRATSDDADSPLFCQLSSYPRVCHPLDGKKIVFPCKFVSNLISTRLTGNLMPLNTPLGKLQLTAFGALYPSEVQLWDQLD